MSNILYLLWTKVTSKAGAIDVGEPALSRRRKAPIPFDDRLCKGDFIRKQRRDILKLQEYIEANVYWSSSPASRTGPTNLDIPLFVHQNRF